MDNLQIRYIYQPQLFENKEILFQYPSAKEIESFNSLKLEKMQRILVPSSVKKNVLDSAGLIEFKDYIYEQYINKKLVIIYGNCHTTVISAYLNGCREFNEEYVIYEIKPIHTITNSNYFNIPVFKYCDLFIHQSIQNKNRYGEEYCSERVIEKLNPNCRILSIPNVYHLPICFFPQYSSKSEFKRRDGSAVFFRDKLLDAASEKGWSYRKTVHDYWDCKHFKKEELDDKLMKFLKKVEEREKEWDIKCLEFIKENYQKNQLFYDPNHPTNFFLKYISEEILKELEISFDRKEWDKINPHSLTGYQMPILPEVKENFKMVFKENDEFRKDSYCKVRLGKMGGGMIISSSILLVHGKMKMLKKLVIV